MSRSARTSTATTFLLHHVELAATGRASVGAGAASVDVYLMNGQVMAAQAPDDVRQLIRTCYLRGGLTEVQAATLDEQAEVGAQMESARPVFGQLLDLAPPELMDHLLFDRFRQNLGTFCGSSNKPTWHPLSAVFVDNLQMSAASAAVIEACCRLWNEASLLDLDAELVRGSGRIDNKEQRLVAARLTDTPQTASAILLQLPLEPLAARVVMLEMLRTGAAAVPNREDQGEDVDDEPTAYTRDDDLTEQIARSSTEVTDQPTGQATNGQIVRTTPGAAPVLASTSPANVQVGNARAEEQPRADDPQSAGSLTSLSAWLDAAATVDEDELDFFSDHDYDRGNGDDGAFSTDAHNLDRIEVASSVASEAIEADEAPTARFSAPMLSEDEALDKIGVANAVLALVVRAFDDADGAGRGRAVVQLLVDGSPSRYAALLHDLQVDEQGQLPDAEILENLYGRPPSEHRQLINQTLVDIIERALSSAADELPDAEFDHVLESVAGYRQRLGL